MGLGDGFECIGGFKRIGGFNRINIKKNRITVPGRTPDRYPVDKLSTQLVNLEGERLPILLLGDAEKYP